MADLVVNGQRVAQFQAAFPFFRTTEASLIQATLARASRWVAPSVWGDRVDDGVNLLAAHWLFQDPLGASTELVGKDNSSTPYGKQFDELRAAVVGPVAFTAGGGWWCGR